MQIQYAAYHVLHPLFWTLRTNRHVIRRAFGVRVPPDVAVSFDATTILLSRAVRQVATPEDCRALELGIGQAALVGLSLTRHFDIQLDGLDCAADRVESSRRVAEYSGARARFWTSDLFSEVPAENQYDLVFFNPPYVPTSAGEELKLTERLSVAGSHWDGGHDGTSVLRQFLAEVPAYLTPRGRVIFGVQNMFVPDETVQHVVSATGLVIRRRLTKRFLPSTAYVLELATVAVGVE